MTTTSTDTAPSPQDFKRPTGRLFVATLLVLTTGAGMWLGYQQRQLADLTEQLRVLRQSSALTPAPVPVDPRLTALEQKVAELERKPAPGPSPIQPPAPVPSPQPNPDPSPPLTPVEARLAKLEAESVRLKSLDMPAFGKRLEASEQKQNQLSGQLTGLTQQQKDAASKQNEIKNEQDDMRKRLANISNRILEGPKS